MTRERTIYRERTAWPVWASALYWGAFGAVSYLLLIGYDTDLAFRLRVPAALLILGGGALLGRTIIGLTVLVQETRLFLFIGSWPVIKRVVPFTEIVDLESRQYRPIADFGGWGVRGMGKKKAWTARGNEAVVLTLTGGRELYVGSDHPHRLEERIRTTAGDRLGAEVRDGDRPASRV